MKDKILINADPKTGIVVGKATIKQIKVANDDGDFSDEFTEAHLLKNMAMADKNTDIISGLEVEIGMDTESFLDEAPTLGELSTDMIKKVKNFGADVVDADPMIYLYTEERGLHIRPYFSVEIENTDDAISIKEGAVPIFPINTKVRLKIKYNDPDKVGFIEQIDHLKIKDSYDFVEIGNDVPKINKKTKTNRLTIESEFPGMCKIRVKDDKHLCGVDRFEIRFKNSKVKK